MHLLTFSAPSHRDLFDSRRAVNSIEDMKGLKLRVPKNKVMIATFQAFGAEPVPLSGYGWAARLLQYCVRNREVIPLAEAIRRITSLPASRLGLGDRGTLKIGNWADVTVFDPTQIKSRFILRQLRSYSDGIAHAMVNGKLAMQGGQRMLRTF